MKQTKCPDCQTIIPDYRQDDPYCDCGWQLNRPSNEQEELSWIIAVVGAIVICGVQIVVLFFVHFIASHVLSFIVNLLAPFFTLDIISIFHWFTILLIDFVVLSLLYFFSAYFIAKKSTHPIMLVCIFAFIVVSFKFLVVDPYSNIAYPFLGYIVNILLLLVTISSGVLIRYLGKH